MEQRRVFAMFPGQGAQTVGMGRSFWEGSNQAKERFQEADETLGFSLSTLCFDGPIEKLTETAIAQPALLTVSVIAFERWAEQHGTDSVRVAAGHSLGEYSALVAAGALNFADAVRLVHYRGRFMQEAVPLNQGKMIAVLGRETEEIKSALESAGSTSVEVANINAPGQIVLAGSATDVDRFVLTNSGWKIIELQVSAPFHCSLMQPAAEALAPLLAETPFQTPAFPIVQNVTGAPVTDPEELRQNLRDQVCGTVRWVQCVERGMADYAPEVAIEFGSGKVLSGLLKRISKGFPAQSVSSPEDL